MPFKPYLVYLVTGEALFIGLHTLLFPYRASFVLGIPFPYGLLSTAHLPVKGSRDVTIGLAYFAFAWHRQWEAVDTLMLSHTFTRAIDGLVVWRFGSKRWSMMHFGGVLVLMSLALLDSSKLPLQ